MTQNPLTPEQHHILREKGTEPPFSGKYVNHHEDGVYRCVGCGASLFASDAKFDSGTGWPSFTDVVEQGNVELREDASGGTHRTEVVCAACGGHLGHVFDDGPKEMPDGTPTTGKRYCINSTCLDFSQDKTEE